jgi:hypothetical protein
MPNFTIDLALEGDRERLRRDLTAIFLDEMAGTSEESNYYTYVVYKRADDVNVVLARPTWLNKGFDFAICVPSCSFRSPKLRWSTRPSHDHLCAILHALRRGYPEQFRYVAEGIRQAYACLDFGPALLEASGIHVEGLHGIRGRIPGDIAVVAARWMFIEQDITYWTHSGRAKLLGKLRNEGLV